MSRRRHVAKLALILGGIGVALLMGEGATRLTLRALHRDPVVVGDPVAGWRGRPDMTGVLKVYAGGLYRYSTDGMGRRVVLEPGRAPQARDGTLVLLGDSFVEGMGVGDSETFGWTLAHDLKRNVVNLGGIGYGTDQELLKLEEYLRASPSERVDEIAVLVYDNDVMDVQRTFDPYLARSKPRFDVSDGRLVMAPYRLPLLDRLMDVSRLFWLLRSRLSPLLATPDPPFDDGSGLDIVVLCLEEMRRLADARGAHLHVLAYRRLRGVSPIQEGAFKRFVNRTDAVDVTFELGGESDIIGPDGVHWNARGHQRVASIVEDLLANCRNGVP